MANFHDTLVLNKYLLSLFGIDAIGKKIIGKSGVELFSELKHSINEGYSEEGNTKYLQILFNHQYPTEQLNRDMLQQYDENIVRFTKEISEKRPEMIQWKYFQYLSLLFTEIYLDKYFSNPTKLLSELNEFVIEFNRKQVEEAMKAGNNKAKDIFQAQKFKIEDLRKLAFWNATGSGKTLLMHINIKQYLHYAQKNNQKHQNKVILITPNEGLTKQHLEEFNLSNIDANIFSKNSGAMFSGKAIEILEITKLSEDSGDKTVAVDSFETENLVLIDEGHGGMGGDSWKKYRDKLSETGFAFEYSATFGQAIAALSGKKKEAFTQEYAKSILFDYSYKYFYEDGYGKDYRIMNLREEDDRYMKNYLIANLISFYQQLLIYQEKKDLVADFLLHKPLWVFVGGSVNAVRTQNGKNVSDVLQIIYFLTDFLKNPESSIQGIHDILNNKAGLVDKYGYSIFETSFSYLISHNLSAEDVFEGINRLIFNNTQLGANLYLDNLKGVDGELGLRVGESDYFGVINVGDEKKLHSLAVENGVLGDEKDFSKSLFESINEPKDKKEPQINLLIGSKKFTEGWSSWRVSSMGLMNVGKSEGAQIIQLFGRGIRLKGYQFSLKRSQELDDFQRPDGLRQLKPILRPLETLHIFGIHSDYMEQFKKFLEEEGLPANDSNWITIKVPTKKKKVVEENRLKLIQVKDELQFKKHVLFDLELDLKRFDGKLIELDWYPKIDLKESRKNLKIEELKNINTFSEQHLQLIDWNQVYLIAQQYKDEKAYYNLKVDFDKIKQIFNNRSWYKIYIPNSEFEFSNFNNLFTWQDLAETLIKKYMEQYYLFEKNAYDAENIEAVILNGNDDNFIFEYEFRLNSENDISLYQQKVEELKNEVLQDSFEKIEIGAEVSAFDNLLHLYKPLVYAGGNNNHLIKISPIALDVSERRFLDDLFVYVQKNQSQLQDTEIHVLRNQSKKGLGFFTEGNNFYPDFILWVIKDGKQYIKFIDPKGIRNSKGIGDPKIQFHRFLKEKIQPQVINNNIFLDSFIVSNTLFLEVQWKGLLSIHDFNKENVYFQNENSESYISSLLKTE